VKVQNQQSCISEQVLNSEFSSRVLPHDSNFKCGVCNKPFVGSEFVLKHLKNKHEEVVRAELFRKLNKGLSMEDLMKEAYLQDPLKMLNQPSGTRPKRVFQDRKQREERRPRQEYVDYDDPKIREKELGRDRQLVSYDDLF